MNPGVNFKASFWQVLVLTLAAVTLASTASFATSVSTPAWTRLARQVGQTEKTRLSAMKQLRETKDLNSILLKALDTRDRALALDVIANMRLEELVPGLLTRISSDEDGFLVIALNSMLNEKNKNLILNTYMEKLAPGRPAIYSAASLVAMLEPLGRLGIPLPHTTLTPLFTHDFPEVRMASLSYVRMMTLQHRNRIYVDFITKALQSTPQQLRVQALFLIDEMTKKPELKGKIDFPALTATCSKEKGSLKDLCRGVMARAKGVSKS
jgi:HEAT repeat protein